MRPSRALVFVGLLTVAVSSGNAKPVETQDKASLTIGADLEYRSRYLFSGVPFSGSSVTQARLSLGYGGFTFNALTNYDFDTSELNEGDVWADYFHQLNEMIGVYVGGAIYRFKNFKRAGKWDPTVEFYAGISTSLPGNPSLHYARDFELTDGGQIARLTLSHEVPVGAVTVTGTGNIVYNDNYYRVGSNFSHLDLSISINVQLGRFTVTPMVTYQEPLADDFDDFWVGVLTLHGEF
jgi:hypothetical protein